MLSKIAASLAILMIGAQATEVESEFRQQRPGRPMRPDRPAYQSARPEQRPTRPMFGPRPTEESRFAHPQQVQFGHYALAEEDRPEMQPMRPGKPERPLFGSRPERGQIIGKSDQPEINVGRFGGASARPAAARPYIHSRKGAYRPGVITARHVVPNHSYYGVAPKVDETIRASCEFDFQGNQAANGRISLSQKAGDLVSMVGEFEGLSTGQHALKVHAIGDLMSGCSSTGDVFNPYGIGLGHYYHDIDGRRVGDIAQLMVTSNEGGHYGARDALISLSGPDSIIGRSIVLYEGPDDHDEIDRHPTEWRKGQQRTGMISQIACCVVGLAKGEKDAIKEDYQYSPTATNSIADAHRKKIEREEWEANASEREKQARKQREALDQVGGARGRFAAW